MTINIEVLLTKEEAMDRLKISRTSFNTLLKENLIPKVKVGKRSVRFKASEIEAFIERRSNNYNPNKGNN